MATNASIDDAREPCISTGIPALDLVLNGGLRVNHLYLVEGVPGSGKTTLALQYLIDGARRGESVLYVTLSETADELNMVARSHGWTLDGVHIRDLAPTENALDPDEQYSIFHPSEVERTHTLQQVLADVDRLKPTRVVFDSLSELRLLADHPLRYRRQILALKQFFAGRKCTVLLLDDMSTQQLDLQVQSIAHAVLRLSQVHQEYGAERRRLTVLKYRGVAYRGGNHDFVIRRGGLELFPRLVAAEHRKSSSRETLSSGVEGLDRLLGGGLERGTSTLVVGAAGCGKSSLAIQFAVAAAERDQTAAMFTFDESLNTLMSRTAGLGINLAAQVEKGLITIVQVDPAEMSPGEFAHHVRGAADRGASIVVIDSLNGYLNAMPDERHLMTHLHELLTYLGQLGVATLLVAAQPGLIGTQMETPGDASYLADGVILLRYYELGGEVRQALSVVKKRSGAHERTIRQLRLTPHGIEVGEPLSRFRGVLTGVPTPDGEDGKVLLAGDRVT